MRRRSRPRLPDTIRLPRQWRRSWPGVLIVILIALVVAYDRGALSGQRNEPGSAATGREDNHRRRQEDLGRYHNRAFRVSRVIDGDTLDLDVADGTEGRTRVRLWGVDTPEIRGETGPLLAFARTATEFTRETVEGRDVYVELSPKQTRDRYGRVLAYIYMDRNGVMLNEQLIELGLGQSDRRFPHHYLNRFEAAERRAQQKGLGMWRFDNDQ